jgi:hypothetical protein
MMANNNWHARLQEIARADRLKDNLDELRRVRDVLYEMSGLKELDAAIATAANRPDNLREQLRETVQLYVLETGETDIHDLIEVRQTPKPVYDDKEALAWCEEHATDFVRVKRSLDKRKFNTAVRNDAVDFAGAEMVNELTIAINAVGHLLEGEAS